MAWFLMKTEPDEFSFDDLVRVGREAWDGVTNPAAQKFMRSMKKGDRVFVYHTGVEKRIAGTADVVRGAYADPDKPATLASGEPKFVLVDLAPDRAAVGDLTLAGMKADAVYAGFELLRQPRLSVMEVPDGLAERMLGTLFP